MGKVLDAELFDVDSTEEEKMDKVTGPETPTYGSPEWNDYVMSKFDKRELIDGNPICSGLRRVAEELLGDIVSSGPRQVYPATDPNGPGRATVVFEVVFNWFNAGEPRTFADVSDVWHGNTDDLFCAHPVATASTRAEGRALRKALKVKCLAAEELARKKDVEAIVQSAVRAEQGTDGEWKSEDPISDPQINFIDGKCKQLDINVSEFINMGENTYKSIKEVSKKVASKMLSILNEYQTSNKDIPDNIMGYNKNWRD